MSKPERWQEKLLRTARGMQTGAIVAAILGRDIQQPKYVGKAVVTSDGFVMCNFITKNGESKHGALVSDVDGVCDNLRALVHVCKLTSEQATEFYNIAKAWIAIDYRAVKTWPL